MSGYENMRQDYRDLAARLASNFPGIRPDQTPAQYAERAMLMALEHAEVWQLQDAKNAASATAL